MPLKRPRVWSYKVYAGAGVVFIASCLAIGLDRDASHYLHQTMIPNDPALQLLTGLGDGRLLIPACLVFTLAMYLLKRPQPSRPLYALLAFLISGAVTHILKSIIGRPRPYALADTRYLNMTNDALQWFSLNKDFWSFPSGHTTAVFALAWFTMTQLPGKKGRFTVLAVATIVAFSRVALAKHYFADTFAGASIGIIVAQLIVDLILFI